VAVLSANFDAETMAFEVFAASCFELASCWVQRQTESAYDAFLQRIFELVSLPTNGHTLEEGRALESLPVFCDASRTTTNFLFRPVSDVVEWDIAVNHAKIAARRAAMDAMKAMGAMKLAAAPAPAPAPAPPPSKAGTTDWEEVALAAAPAHLPASQPQAAAAASSARSPCSPGSPEQQAAASAEGSQAAADTVGTAQAMTSASSASEQVGPESPASVWSWLEGPNLSATPLGEEEASGSDQTQMPATAQAKRSAAVTAPLAKSRPGSHSRTLSSSNWPSVPSEGGAALPTSNLGLAQSWPQLPRVAQAGRCLTAESSSAMLSEWGEWERSEQMLPHYVHPSPSKYYETSLRLLRKPVSPRKPWGRLPCRQPIDGQVLPLQRLGSWHQEAVPHRPPPPGQQQQQQQQQQPADSDGAFSASPAALGRKFRLRTPQTPAAGRTAAAAGRGGARGPADRQSHPRGPSSSTSSDSSR
jgi:hypothetical protein